MLEIGPGNLKHGFRNFAGRYIKPLKLGDVGCLTIGALIVRIGFWCILYYSWNPKIVYR